MGVRLPALVDGRAVTYEVPTWLCGAHHDTIGAAVRAGLSLSADGFQL